MSLDDDARRFETLWCPLEMSKYHCKHRRLKIRLLLSPETSGRITEQR